MFAKGKAIKSTEIFFHLTKRFIVKSMRAPHLACTSHPMRVSSNGALRIGVVPNVPTIRVEGCGAENQNESIREWRMTSRASRIRRRRDDPD
jgi:hypothetical protein